MKLYFSIGFCGTKAPIYGNGSPVKVARFIRQHVPELSRHVSTSLKELASPTCEAFGASGCESSFKLAKYNLSRFACSEFESVTL